MLDSKIHGGIVPAQEEEDREEEEAEAKAEEDSSCPLSYSTSPTS
jgi:hypothetical protein